jgi:hypothetical protein
VQHTIRELEVELANDTDRDEIKARIEAALADDDNVLWLTDKNGKELAVPSKKIGYVELGRAETERRIGFGHA